MGVAGDCYMRNVHPQKDWSAKGCSACRMKIACTLGTVHTAYIADPVHTAYTMNPANTAGSLDLANTVANSRPSRHQEG